jgi:hypothetical protein
MLNRFYVTVLVVLALAVVTACGGSLHLLPPLYQLQPRPALPKAQLKHLALASLLTLPIHFIRSR